MGIVFTNCCAGNTQFGGHVISILLLQAKYKTMVRDSECLCGPHHGEAGYLGSAHVTSFGDSLVCTL